MTRRTLPLIAFGLTTVILAGSVTLNAAAQHKKPKKAAASAAPTKAQIEAGKKVYDASGCGACHAVGDKGGKAGPALTKIGADKAWTAAKLTATIRDPKKTLNTDKMPAYGPDKLSDKDLKSLLAYLGSLK